MGRIIVTMMLLFLLGLSPATGFSPAVAQDATPAGSPAAGECLAPELPPGTPTPPEELEAMFAEEMGMASPVAAEATPAEGEMAPDMAAASPIPAGTPADDATSERVIAAIENVIGCYNTGDYLSVAALFTPAGLVAEFGMANPYDADVFLAGGPQLMITTLSDVQVHDDGRYSADLVYSFGGAQIERERWILVESGDFLLVDDTPSVPVEVPEGAVTIDANMVDYAFELSETTAPADTPIVFKVTNSGEYPHELLILQLPEGATPEQILDGTIGFEDVTFMGATYSEGGQPAPDLVISGLAAGTYTIVCFVDIPDGIPHVARGMIAEIVIE